MPNANLVFMQVDPAAPEAATLIAALDNELRERYPGAPIHGIEPVGFRRTGGVFLMGQLAGIHVACGALRPLGDGCVELKRMFVRKDQRGRGFGKAMLAALEEVAVRLGYRTNRLGTGVNQPETLGPYEGA